MNRVARPSTHQILDQAMSTWSKNKRRCVGKLITETREARETEAVANAAEQLEKKQLADIAEKKLERGFFTCASHKEYLEKSEALLKQGVIDNFWSLRVISGPQKGLKVGNITHIFKQS